MSKSLNKDIFAHIQNSNTGTRQSDSAMEGGGGVRVRKGEIGGQGAIHGSPEKVVAVPEVDAA